MRDNGGCSDNYETCSETSWNSNIDNADVTLNSFILSSPPAGNPDRICPASVITSEESTLDAKCRVEIVCDEYETCSESSKKLETHKSGYGTNFCLRDISPALSVLKASLMDRKMGKILLFLSLILFFICVLTVGTKKEYVVATTLGLLLGAVIFCVIRRYKRERKVYYGVTEHDLEGLPCMVLGISEEVGIDELLLKELLKSKKACKFYVSTRSFYVTTNNWILALRGDLSPEYVLDNRCKSRALRSAAKAYFKAYFPEEMQIIDCSQELLKREESSCDRKELKFAKPLYNIKVDQITADSLVDIMLFSGNVRDSSTMLNRYMRIQYARLCSFCLKIRGTEFSYKGYKELEEQLTTLLPYFLKSQVGNTFAADIRKHYVGFRYVVESRLLQPDFHFIVLLQVALNNVRLEEQLEAQQVVGTSFESMARLYTFSSSNEAFFRPLDTEHLNCLLLEFFSTGLIFMVVRTSIRLMVEKSSLRISSDLSKLPYCFREIPGLLQSINCVLKASVNAPVDAFVKSEVRGSLMPAMAIIPGFAESSIGRFCNEDEVYRRKSRIHCMMNNRLGGNVIAIAIAMARAEIGMKKTLCTESSSFCEEEVFFRAMNESWEFLSLRGNRSVKVVWQLKQLKILLEKLGIECIQRIISHIACYEIARLIEGRAFNVEQIFKSSELRFADDEKTLVSYLEEEESMEYGCFLATQISHSVFCYSPKEELVGVSVPKRALEKKDSLRKKSLGTEGVLG